MNLTRRKELLAQADELAAALGRYRTLSSGEEIDPSRVSEVARYLEATNDLASAEEFLTLLPGSFHARMSRSAQPQLAEIARVVRPLVRKMKDARELVYVLAWTKRILQTAERGARPLDGAAPRGDAPPRGPPPRGGPRGGSRG